jgi:hypothetical protein
MKREDASVRGRWLLAGLGALVLPKCLLCLVAYGAVIAGPELCGAGETGSPVWSVLGLTLGAAGAWALMSIAVRRS